ncbi:MAG: protein-L-isoaspartate(D-aspartate) O-methyltransferase [Bacteroidales bacterium]|nr:protein-L-isoaspartate(D-aspartate) O-methyltransferase [Bacteroidales bacterium]
MRSRSGIVFLLISLVIPSFLSAQERYDELRSRMVEEQLVERGITDDRVLGAMSKIERHLFIPAAFRCRAYEDYPVSIEEGQTISQPYIVALMTELLRLKPGMKVLEIGTGSGYQAAVLAEIVEEVYTIELIESLVVCSDSLFDLLGYDNIHTRHGDGYMGWEEHAPYDAIIVTCAPSDIPEPLTRQLKEGGRMVIPVGDTIIQDLVLLRKRMGKLRRTKIAPVMFVPMKSSDGKRY